MDERTHRMGELSLQGTSEMAGSSCHGLDCGPTISTWGKGWAGGGQASEAQTQGSWRQQGSEKVCEMGPFKCS